MVGSGQTAIGVDENGILEMYQGPDVTRDDTDQLRAVAALALAVYGKQRRGIRLTEQGVWASVPLGGMVGAVTLGQFTVAVNAVATKISWDFVRQTTTTETGYVDLDTRSLAR